MKNASRRQGNKSGNKNKKSGSNSGKKADNLAGGQPSLNADKNAVLSEETVQKEAAKAQESKNKAKASSPEREVLYQVKTKRDSDILKAYITFTYRVFHPNVTGRLLFYGILVAAPALFLKITGIRIACLVIGALIICLALFRQYISLALTKRNDVDYNSGIEFTYEFTMNDASFYRGDDLTGYISKYKDIDGLYHDEDYYYLSLKTHDLFILPKSRFTIGDPEAFEDFIYKRCKKTCRWIPNKFSNKMKKRRAARAVNQQQM